MLTRPYFIVRQALEWYVLMGLTLSSVLAHSTSSGSSPNFSSQAFLEMGYILSAAWSCSDGPAVAKFLKYPIQLMFLLVHCSNEVKKSGSTFNSAFLSSFKSAKFAGLLFVPLKPWCMIFWHTVKSCKEWQRHCQISHKTAEEISFGMEPGTQSYMLQRILLRMCHFRT